MRPIDADELKTIFIDTLKRIKKNPKMSKEEMHIIAACDTVCTIIDDMPTLVFVPSDRKKIWEE